MIIIPTVHGKYLLVSSRWDECFGVLCKGDSSLH